jgi:hypothetical protein
MVYTTFNSGGPIAFGFDTASQSNLTDKGKLRAAIIDNLIRESEELSRRATRHAAALRTLRETLPTRKN